MPISASTENYMMRPDVFTTGAAGSSGLVPYGQLPGHLQQWLEAQAAGARAQGIDSDAARVYQSLGAHGWQWPSAWGPAGPEAQMMLGDIAGRQQYGQPAPTPPGAPPGWGQPGSGTPMAPGGVNPAPGPLAPQYQPFPAWSLPEWFNPAPWDYQYWQGMTPEQLQGTVAMYQQALPWTQMAQNAQQWGQEFGENQKRFWEAQWPWQQKTDQFAMDLAQQQQDFTESSWGKEFEWGQEKFGQELGWEKEKFGQGLGWEKERFGQEFGLKTREQEALESWRDTQAQLQREQMQTEQENAALAAWGRKFRPNTRYL